MVLNEGIDSEAATDRDYTLRTDLSQEEIIGLAGVLSRITAKLDAEAEYNKGSLEISQSESDKSRTKIGRIRSAFSSQSNPDGRALALFSASNRENYLSEQTSLFRLLSTASSGLESSYGNTEISIETASPEGQNSMQKISLKDYLEGAYAANTTEANLAIETLQDEAGSRIKQAGKRGAITGAIAAGVIGLGIAGTQELVSGGKTATIFDVLGARPTPETISAAALSGTHKISGNNELIVQHNYGKSGATIKDNLIEIIDPSGKKIEVPISSNGTVSRESMAKLVEQGVTLSQEPGSIRAVNMTDFMRNHGAKKTPQINEWLGNNTRRYDGTELAQHRFNSNGDLTWSQDFGTARNGQTVIDMAQAGKNGQVSMLFISGKTAIEVPLVMKDGKLLTEFTKGSVLRESLFTKGGAFRGDMVQTIVRDQSGKVASVAVSQGLGETSTTITSNNLFDVMFERPVEQAAESIGYTLVAPVPTRVSSQFENNESPETPANEEFQPQEETKKETSSDKEPVAEENPTAPEETVKNPSEENIQKIIEQAPDRTDKVDVAPLSPELIVERLEEEDKKGTHLTVNNEHLELNGTENGKLKFTVIEGEKTGQNIEMEPAQLEDSVRNGLVLIDGFLGANNAEALYDDFQSDEIVYDSQIGSYVRVEKVGDNFRYIELDENGKDKVREEFSNPRVYMKNNFIYRLQHGSLIPVQKRGVKTLGSEKKAA
jgi:hypothetical protein